MIISHLIDFIKVKTAGVFICGIATEHADVECITIMQCEVHKFQVLFFSSDPHAIV